ncbi:serine/threonine protein kinase [Polyangium jinanense]|uniref:Protein kinase n=1 Tax=Polyangium jinanense TaxID=2829994 RepID=A0A9X3X620_9BACT|nr:serine/threonine-protein kinase [Polyangium jinanense]MDC3956106.1 protein kinase [Polyangium jinanense]MDC3982863.1 protein kinase [Polyangium jinanense]
MQVERRSDSSWEDEPSGLPVAIGDVLDGKYRVLRVLGKGGMGVIVAAVHVELGHRVALKFLLKSATHNEEVVARFAREARAAAMIQNEHATRVLDIGRLPSGQPYMVLELLEGSDLGAYIARNGPLPIDDAVTYVLEACEAIAEAHSLGIVHRDLKPDNLFLARRPDGSRTVKVLDFGISKLSADKETSPERGGPLTTTSAVIGSPMYMSPEQLRATRDADPRSDIWSIGVTLYELIAGEGPFPWQSLPELCAAILKDPPMPLKERLPDVPPGLDAAILRCLHKNPADRYANIGELAVALSPFGRRPGAIASSERAVRLLARGSSADPCPSARAPLQVSDASTSPTLTDPRVQLSPPHSTPPVAATAILVRDLAGSKWQRMLRPVPLFAMVAAIVLVGGAGIRLRRVYGAPNVLAATARGGIEATLAPAFTKVKPAASVEAAETKTPPPVAEDVRPAPRPMNKAPQGGFSKPRPQSTITDKTSEKPPSSVKRPNPFDGRE